MHPDNEVKILNSIKKISLKIKPINKKQNNFTKLIEYHNLTLISNVRNIGDCFFDTFITAFFNKSNTILTLNTEELNEFKHFRCNLVSSSKPILNGNKHINWRAHKIGSSLSKEINTGMDGICLTSSYLDRRILAINGNCIKKTNHISSKITVIQSSISNKNLVIMKS